MGNTRAFCDLPENDHALVPVQIEIRDNLGALAIQVLASKKDLSQMSYSDMLDELNDIVTGLHDAYIYKCCG